MSDTATTEWGFPDIPTPINRTVPSNPAVLYDNFDRRIHDLEQQLGGNYGPSITAAGNGDFPSGITIGGVPVTLTPPPAVTGLSVTIGAHYDQIFADVEWTEAILPPGDPGDAISFDVDLAEKNPGPVYVGINSFNTSGTNYRLTPLEPEKNYAVRIVPVNRIGIRGSTPSWTDFTTGKDTTIPPAPSGLALVRGASTVVVKFTGLTVGQAPDVASGNGTYEIEIDTANTFATGNKRAMVSTATVVSFSDIIGELPQWYARVRAIDASGNVSPWSSVAGPSGPMGGVNDSMIIADLSAAKIQFGTMDGDRIAANTLNANRIETSSITAANITLAGGSLRAGTPISGSGALLNSQGFRLYQGGVATVVLDAITGTATFTGSISSGSTITGSSITGGSITGAGYRTAVSGERIEIFASASGKIDYYSGAFGEVDNGYIYWDSIPSAGSSARRGRLLLTHASLVGTFEDDTAFVEFIGSARDGSRVPEAFIKAGPSYISVGNGTSHDINIWGYEDVNIWSNQDIRLESPSGIYLNGGVEVSEHIRVPGIAYGPGTSPFKFKGVGGQNIEVARVGGIVYIYVDGFGYQVHP